MKPIESKENHAKYGQFLKILNEFFMLRAKTTLH